MSGIAYAAIMLLFAAAGFMFGLSVGRDQGKESGRKLALLEYRIYLHDLCRSGMLLIHKDYHQLLYGEGEGVQHDRAH